MPSCSHSAVAPAATACRAMSGVWPDGRKTSTSPTTPGTSASRRYTGSSRIVSAWVDRDDPPAVPLHVGGHVVGGFLLVAARADHGDPGVAAQDALDGDVGIAHPHTVAGAGLGSTPRSVASRFDTHGVPGT